MADMHKINRVEVRNLQMEDYGQLAQSFTRVYADKDVFWTREQIHKLIDIFPEGQIVTVVGERIVGCALSIIVDYDMVKGDHTYAKVTGNETFSTHNPKGNILYGIEVFIHPDYRGLRLARRMYDYRKELCEKLNLKAIMFGGRIPNYHKYADRMRPKEYIDRVRSREIYDPVLTFQLSNDFHVRRVMPNYLPNDEESCHCATLLQWDNIYYQPPTQEFVDKKTTVRVGLVQWQMRTYKTLDDVFEQVEFFVDAVSDYKSDFVLFPEYFNAPLMARFNNLGEAQSIRGLAQYTEEIRDRFIDDGRYAAAFVREKLRLSGWGEYKIRAALTRKGIDRALIDRELAGFDREGMHERLQAQLARKARTVRQAAPRELKAKLIRYGLSLGYDYGTVIETVSTMIEDNEPCEPF